jgi:hypothetical protein
MVALQGTFRDEDGRWAGQGLGCWVGFMVVEFWFWGEDVWDDVF